MTKQEILKVIENGESVWFLSDIFKNPVEINMNEHTDKFIDRFDFYCYTDKNGEKREHCIYNLFKTKAEAEHYLHHANVKRTEQLPFLTWEEFLEGKELFFTNKSGYLMCLRIVDTKLGKKIGRGGANGYFDLQQTWNLTEEDFYKAYDECVRLFRGGE